MTDEQVKELLASLSEAQKTDEHLCPDGLVGPISRLLEERKRLLEALKHVDSRSDCLGCKMADTAIAFAEAEG